MYDIQGNLRLNLNLLILLLQYYYYIKLLLVRYNTLKLFNSLKNFQKEKVTSQ